MLRMEVTMSNNITPTLLTVIAVLLGVNLLPNAGDSDSTSDTPSPVDR